jgi:Tol biopolymer transport system component
LDPSTGRLAQVTLAGVDLRAAVVAVAPDGQQVAYVTAGASPSTSLWPAAGTGPVASPQDDRRETVWIAPLDGSSAPRPMLELDKPVTRGFGADAEHIVDLVWTPDGTRLVAVSRQGGSPTRTRLFLVQLEPESDSGAAVHVTQLVVLPADIAPGATVPDPSGQWLVLMAHAAAAAGGRDVLMLCTVELRPGGTFREIADLGSAQRAPCSGDAARTHRGRSRHPAQPVAVDQTT